MIRILIVGSVRVYVDSLSRALRRADGIEVVEALAPAEALAAVSLLLPDVLLLDTSAPDGLASARAIRDAAPTVKVIALGVREIETEILACAEAGVSGYVAETASLRTLAVVVQRVARGETPCPPEIVATLFRYVGTLAAAVPGGEGEGQLTTREAEILRLIAEGQSNKQIADVLHIELSTVKNHTHRIFGKLGVHHRADAIARLRAAPTSSRSS